MFKKTSSPLGHPSSSNNSSTGGITSPKDSPDKEIKKRQSTDPKKKKKKTNGSSIFHFFKFSQQHTSKLELYLHFLNLLIYTTPTTKPLNPILN
jgi:hypothetical protein